MHRLEKKDRPSGTSLQTATRMERGGRRSAADPQRTAAGAGRASGSPFRSVRASCCTIRHDSFSRESFVPGMFAAVRGVMHVRGLVIGLDTILDEMRRRSVIDVAVVGATGAVGETILRVLEERAVPIGAFSPFASRARDGAVRFRGADLDVRATSARALRDFDVVFFASGEDASETYAPALIERGRVVIDNSATFRMRPMACR